MTQNCAPCFIVTYLPHYRTEWCHKHTSLRNLSTRHTGAIIIEEASQGREVGYLSVSPLLIWWHTSVNVTKLMPSLSQLAIQHARTRGTQWRNYAITRKTGVYMSVNKETNLLYNPYHHTWNKVRWLKAKDGHWTNPPQNSAKCTYLQWNLSIADTFGTAKSVLISKVSTFQG